MHCPGVQLRLDCLLVLLDTCGQSRGYQLHMKSQPAHKYATDAQTFKLLTGASRNNCLCEAQLSLSNQPFMRTYLKLRELTRLSNQQGATS